MTEITAIVHNCLEDERVKEYKEFFETKAGVKGLVDAGVVKVPRIFIHPPENLPKPSSEDSCCIGLQVPIIDFHGLENGQRGEIIDKIRQAAETWGFFQVVNHGIPGSLMDDLLNDVRQFHEQPLEVRKEWYSHDETKKVRYYSNGFYNPSMAAQWKDGLFCIGAQQLEEEQIPEVCRKSISEYVKHVIQLKETISELLSEALGLSSDCFARAGYMKSVSLACNYYPTCPEPELTLGIASHSDPDFLTLLLQDDIGGLQILHQNKWVDVPPVHGAVIANLGDFMQLITNDKFKSVAHRVVAKRGSSRVSVSSFFQPAFSDKLKPYGPMKELVSEDNPPLYRAIGVAEYVAYFRLKGLDGSSALPHFRL
ncbi:1-aminocyclopropane-1-carboxylate oxidase homolog 12-like [Durio zibethinus]|uniref:1-aminocyclopropane-1-carboxylate oxidase homolog 12-like n=1 Tax=Durio zibethinus TaxID=66656 RepID=A0A6P5ZAB6_DURZI|nr:1-aminocyclopropane-1-carboxylate oxidase homolog 12-like [Durio zibethinus]